MDRRAFIAGTLTLLAAPLMAGAQQATRMYRVGLVSLGSGSTRHGMWQSFLEAMRELDYVEGRNLVITLAIAEGRPETLPGLLAALLRATVDVIVTTSTRETMAVKRATSTIPVVMTLTPDPVEQGLVASLARPGGNVTGLTTMAPGTNQKLVELLREAVPSASRLGVLSTGPNAPFPELRRELQAAAQRVEIPLSFIDVKSLEDLERALARAKREGVAGLIAPLSAFTYTHRVRVVQLALKYGLPGIYWVRDFVEEGGLMSYGVSFTYVGRRAAYFVDRILKGAKPADLPVEQPTKFELTINLKTAKALGLTIPQSVLARADEVIQ